MLIIQGDKVSSIHSTSTDIDSIPPATAAPRRSRRARLALLGLLTLLAAGLFWWYSTSRTIGQLAARTRAAIAAGRWDEAENALIAWLKARPESPEAHYLAARVALERQRPDLAVPSLEQAQAAGYPILELDALRGIALSQSGRHDEAVSLLHAAFKAEMGPPALIAESLARSSLGTFRFGLALEAIERWRQLDRDDPRPYLWKADIDTRRGAGAEVVAVDYQEALKRDSSQDEARLGLAEALRESGRYAQAVPEYEAYLARHPDDPAGQVGAGLNAQSLSDLDRAQRFLDRAIELDPTSASALAARAAIALSQNQPEPALAWLDAAARAEPFNPEIQYRRAQALTQLGRHEEAREAREATELARRDNQRLRELREGLIQNPSDPTLQHEIASWMIAHGHEQEGLDWANKTLREHPGHAPTCRLLMEYHERRGEHGRANYYRLQLDPSAPRAPTDSTRPTPEATNPTARPD